MNNSAFPKLLVFGASGYIGSYLVSELLKQPCRVRASSRNAQVLRAREWSNVEIVEADALKPASLEKALDGVDVAYYLVHSMMAGKDFAQVDLNAAENFARVAEKNKVKQIIYLGGLVPEKADSDHIKSRRETGEVLRKAGKVPVTELRAGIIVGPGSAAFEVMRDLVFHLPLMITPKWVRSVSPPIALQNVLYYLVHLALKSEAYHKTFNAAGPETLSYERMMCMLAEAAGRRKPKIIPVPFLSPGLSSYWLKYVTSVPTNIARALIDGLKNDFYADDLALKELLPQQLLDFSSSIERVFTLEKKHTVQYRWVEGAFPIRKQRVDYAFYAKKAGASASCNVSPEQLWQVLSRIGGQQRYFYMNFLWTTREFLDWLVGGPGLSRKRRHPSELRLGDRVDSWTVIGIEKDKRLTLEFGMRAPGAGVLEFEIEKIDHRHSNIQATAYWHPAGVYGLLYWYALELAHLFIFKGMTRAVAKQAQALAEKQINV